MEIEISRINVGKWQRMFRQDRVREIADSIKQLGLLQPIVVTESNGHYNLVAGFHRLEAFKLLGRREIPSKVSEFTTSEAALAEIDENLVRADLLPIERAVHIYRRKEVYEQVHPETKHGGAPGAGKGKGKKVRKDAEIAPFQEDTAKKIGKSSRTVQVNYQIGRALGKYVDDLIETPVADNQKELLKLARIDDEKLPRVVAKLRLGKENVRDAVNEVDNEDKNERLKALPDIPKWDGKFELDTINVCPIEDLLKGDRALPAESVDLIFTDPPWAEDSVALYGKLGELAKHVLKPGSYVLAFSGKMFLPQLMAELGKFLEYVWIFSVDQPGDRKTIHKCNVFGAWRPIVVFKKPGTTATREWVPDKILGLRNKEYHEWQQAIEPVLKYIKAYTQPNEIVLDPFLGGGTTAVACKQLNRHFVVFDKEENSVKVSQERLKENETT